MRKSKKTEKNRKSALDTTEARTPGRAGKRTPKPTAALHHDDALEPIGYDLAWIFPDSPFETTLPEKPKKGRRPFPDNLLLGSRNNWLYTFEEKWHEIGFALIEIRRAGVGTVDDTRKIFDTLKSSDTDVFSKTFPLETTQRVTSKTIRATRSCNSDLHRKAEEMRSRLVELRRSHAEAEHALEASSAHDKEILRSHKKTVERSLRQLEEDLKRTEHDLQESDKQTRIQEAYWYCSQLLDFLVGKRRNRVEPRNLADALAGLPEMGWRESDARCSKMPRSSPCVSLSFLTVKLLSGMLRRKPKTAPIPPIAFFRAQILARPKKGNGIREVLRHSWRDFRLAVEECWKGSNTEELMPYAITAVFLRNRESAKTLAERILADSETLAERVLRI